MYVDCAKYLVLEANIRADLTRQCGDEELNALHVACLSGSIDIVTLLLDNGSNVNETSKVIIIVLTFCLLASHHCCM